MDPSDELAPRERAVAPASALAVTALVLGATSVVLGVTLIWFFLALPMGLCAIVAAVVERRRTRERTGRAAGGVVTAGLVLGCISIPLSLGGLIVIPQMRGAVQETIGMTQEDVSKDLTSVERSFNQSVDDLDKTLSDNVDQSTASLESDFEGLEKSSKEELRQVEERLSAIVEELERTTGADLSEFEAAAATELDELESALRNDLAAANSRVSDVEARLAAEQELLRERLEAVERDVSSVGGP